jgi:hypothetical protein
MNLPARTWLFKNKPPDTALRPTAVITRGESLLDATVYYADTFVSAVNELDRREASSIAYCMKYLKNQIN